MKRALIRRLATLIPTMIIVSVAVFSLRVLIPGGPAEAILGTNANPQAVAVLNKQLGLDRPVVSQYFSWVNDRFVLIVPVYNPNNSVPRRHCSRFDRSSYTCAGGSFTT